MAGTLQLALADPAINACKLCLDTPANSIQNRKSSWQVKHSAGLASAQGS